MQFSWEITEFRYLTPLDSAIAPAFIEIDRAIWSELYLLATKYAKRIEEWMKENAKWQNRSGQARRWLMGEPAVMETTSDMVYIVFGWRLLAAGRTNPPWGVFLEHAEQFKGAYKIVVPALNVFLPMVVADVAALINRMK